MEEKKELEKAVEDEVVEEVKPKAEASKVALQLFPSLSSFVNA